MSVATLREVDGAVVVTIPADELQRAHLSAGMQVNVSVLEKSVEIREQRRRRYTLAELLQEHVEAREQGFQVDDPEWLAAPAVGGEMI